MKDDYPLIQTAFKADNQRANFPFYVEGVERIIHHILPPNFFKGENLVEKFHKQLPIVCWTPIKEPPFEMTFFLCCMHRPDGFRFFYDMITSWLIPGKKVNAPVQFAADFTMPEMGLEKYIAGQVSVTITSALELQRLQENLSSIESEIRLGISSSAQAARILEIKGLASDRKTAFIQENLVALIKRRPQDFAYDILSEMQHFLILCNEEFKEKRNQRHLSRIIAVNYLFCKALTLSHEAYPHRRDVSIKLIRGRLLNQRAILGVVIAVSFLQENERLEERHILNAIKKLIKNCNSVKNSFLSHKALSKGVCSFYLEIEKKERTPFSIKEIELLQHALVDEVKAHIEHFISPLFMSHNEEMILRNILTLSQQLKYVRDLPQCMINFQQQIDNKLEFLVIMVRILKPDTIPITRFFDLVESPIEFFFERKKIVGTIRQKYKKEVNVFKILISKDAFFRQDHSIDLYKARESVARELRQILGEFRDYNGGYLSKERELFLLLTQLLGKTAQRHAFFLENFFYAITPVIMRSTLDAESLKTLFLLFLKAKDEKQNYSFHCREQRNNCFIVITGMKRSLGNSLLKAVDSLNIASDRLAKCLVKEGDIYCFGLIYQEPHPSEIVQLRHAIERTIQVEV